MILFDAADPRKRLRESTTHYHAGQYHQGLDNELIDGAESPAAGPLECQERLGGLLGCQRRAA